MQNINNFAFSVCNMCTLAPLKIQYTAYRVRLVLIVKFIPNYSLLLSFCHWKIRSSLCCGLQNRYALLHSTIRNFCNFRQYNIRNALENNFSHTTTDFMHVLSKIAHSLHQIWVTFCGESSQHAHMKIDCNRKR